MARYEMEAFMNATHTYYEHRGPWFERAFYLEAVRQKVEFDRDYLVGFWTDFLEEKPPNNNKKATAQQWHHRRVLMGEMLAALPRDKPMFTVVQHDDGLCHPWPANLLVFGAGGIGNIPLPLLMPTVKPDHSDRQYQHRVTFMGKTKGPNNRYGVRQQMLEAYAGRPEFERMSGGSYARYCSVIRNSKFVLCPCGYGLTSFRLYEVLSLGAVPVYIHNGAPWLPYADKLDWNELAVIVAPDEIADMPDRIAAIDDKERLRMLSNVRDVFIDYFTMPGVVRQVRDWLRRNNGS